MNKLYRNLDLSHFRSNIVIDEETSTSWNPLIGDRTLSKVNLPTNEIEFPFLVAQVDYSPDEHLTMLRTLYKVFFYFLYFNQYNFVLFLYFVFCFFIILNN